MAPIFLGRKRGSLQRGVRPPLCPPPSISVPPKIMRTVTSRTVPDPASGIHSETGLRWNNEHQFREVGADCVLQERGVREATYHADGLYAGINGVVQQLLNLLHHSVNGHLEETLGYLMVHSQFVPHKLNLGK
ncbi:hypothetical protein MAR_024720 [Mya arenaria]|uniref:Uncharacterized protein n=1 Tax=Mya arenaria TaxID=6604 RepID=A0ABY7DRM3_MYAAR|nr:hypothetical protein MAR_024720 [Mya arenaria]